MPDDVLIKVKNVSKKFCRSLKRSLWYGLQDMAGEVFGNGRSHDELRTNEFWAVKDVSFELRRGECLGLIGRNGAGKTTLLRMLNGLIKPDAGRIEMRGRVGALIALGAGFNPILTGRENIYVNGSVLGLTRREIDSKIEEIIDFAEIRESIDMPVQSYSSGMQVRLGFSVATAMNPDVLLLDEVLAVGDAAFRNKCYRRIVGLRKRAAVIFVSHSMEHVSRVCDRALMLSGGRIACYGSVATAAAAYEGMTDDAGTQDKGFLSLQPPIHCFAVSRLPKEALSCAPIRLTVHVESSAQIGQFLLRIALYDASGVAAADCNFSSTDSAITIEPGSNSWMVEIAHLPLRNGAYRVSFNIIDPAGDLLVWSYKQHELRVIGAYAGAFADCQLPLAKWESVTKPTTPADQSTIDSGV